MFDIQKFDVQQKIINMLNLNSKVLNEYENVHTISNIFNILNTYRNVCAHGERLFCTSTKIEIDDDYQIFYKLLPKY
ncbi:Abi family protein, partial [Staphylococcus aureus]|uniref:Abi family protein n=1 Tax=Staphylococcus aureus TaxID=1280 RepID=UPI00214DE7CA